MRLIAPLLFLIATSTAFAQSPAADWRTIETAHFRVYYPQEYEEWATHAASRLESIREAVSAEVGFAPPQKIDVLVMNPAADPNGLAWPFLDAPRMILYTEAPGPEEVIGAYGSWIDLLAVHETAHLVHMLRPTRNPLGRIFERFALPLNPITLRAPRWVLEGYATVIEGRLTGAGRPTSTIRALILRRWAASGRLPTYGQLNSDRRFLGMSMAYLMGSAYLEWLERRSGEGSLRKLWTRLTARQRRSFDEAFAGVFGERPERLYGQFVAELTASAVTLERETPYVEGALFQETQRASGDPAVSPDGTQLAIVVRQRDVPEKLVVWSTGPATEEEKKFEERIARILRRDPEDVPPVRNKPLPRKPLHTLVLPDGGDIDNPRWTRDGKAIVFGHRAPDADGFLHWDLYRWDFQNLTRITHGADVRDADPLRDGRAIAVRSRHGKTQLVYVDLSTGAVTPRTEPTIATVVSHPRGDPSGYAIAWVEHQNGRWWLRWEDERVATPTFFALPGDAVSPEWLSENQIVASVFTGGFAELYRIRRGAPHEQLTRSGGGAFDPAPASDGRIFFMSLEPDGYVVRVLEPGAGAPAPLRLAGREDAFVPAIPGAPTTPPAFTTQSVTSRAYGVGRQEFSWFTGHNFAPDQRATELGVRFGDVVGRLDTLLIGSLGYEDAPRGFAIASAWRGWPVEVHAHGYVVDDGHCLSFASGDDEGDRQDCLSSTGGELRGVWSRQFARSRMTVEAGALSDELLFASAAFSTRQTFGKSRLEETLRVDVDNDHYRAIAGAAFRAGSTRIALQYQRDGGSQITLGGLPSSVLPRSAYSRRLLDPALPVALLAGDDYDGWRIESTVPLLPFTAFYQRHELGATRLSLAGVEVDFSTDPMPILKFPGLDLTAGVAHVLDAPDPTGVEGDTKWWLGMRWRP